MKLPAVFVALMWAGVSASSAFAQDMQAQCRALGAAPGSGEERLVAIPDAAAKVQTASVVAASGNVPEYCKIEGVVAPNIGFELRMPTTTWNGKFLMSGCGGFCGQISFDRTMPGLIRNYAVVATDMGNRARSWLFAYNNIQGEIDFGYRSTHVVGKVAKELIDIYYGKRASRNYFQGCSTGGRQAMMEAQRFPDDFDGITAGAPVLDETGDPMLYVMWNGLANVDPATGKQILTPEKLNVINDAVMKKCDKMDGLEDKILQDPRSCNFEPSEIACSGGGSGDTCLSTAEVGVVRKIYSGAVNSKGEALFFGAQRGSEYTWTPEWIGPNGRKGTRIDGPSSGMEEFASFMAFFNDLPPGTPASAFDYDRDPQRRYLTEILYNAQNPDLRRFKQRGGKLIHYHGLDDDSVVPGLSIDYYETATRTMGGPEATRDFYRLFMIPGMTHCAGGRGGGELDLLTPIENWVEKGQAPEQVTVYRLVNDRGGPRPAHPLNASQYDQSRPVFAYPSVARYKGRGDPNAVESWERTTPRK